MSIAPVKIANAQAFWGDRNDAARELLERVPDLDYLTLDYLAEVSLSILAQQQVRDPSAGFPRDFIEVFGSLVPYWQGGGRCKLITNAGGLDPHACAQACALRNAELGGPPLRIAVVIGDAILDQLQDEEHPDAESLFRHFDTDDSFTEIRPRLITANVYLGAAPIVNALAHGADIVITGRVADPSLTLAACAFHFDWAEDDWDRWAAGTVAGHLIECGTQVTGGISTDWLSLPHPDRIGFPIIEMEEDGTFVVTKPPGTGGRVDLQTVAEQLVYEISDPERYLSPDLTVSFTGLCLQQVGPDRVRVTGARGAPPSPTYKVSATYRDGYRASGMLTIFGRDAVRKARRCGEIVLERMRAAGYVWREALVECLGTGACAGGVLSVPEIDAFKEVVLRISIEAEDRDVVEYFTRQIIPLVTSGPQGTTGYSEGRPRVHPIVRYWPCLIDRRYVTATVDFVELSPDDPITMIELPVDDDSQPVVSETREWPVDVVRLNSPPQILWDLAIARSGDKGGNANIGVVCRNPQDFDRLRVWLTKDRVAKYLAPLGPRLVERFELPNLHGLNFLVHGILTNGLRIDVQGKTLGQLLLEMPLDGDWSAGASHG
ncbi:acyclic terpene utilization AtuA family protein [Schlesneria paludicola]|uniref:acyclic terpene utilization AtuA family protein n=1 Tax=Schlesneria paludicola TaxID=360056 RepID=UPI00029AB1B0|nr:acyclic terpene utilization AtuA family protein [Schlesneria paludicola]